MGTLSRRAPPLAALGLALGLVSGARAQTTTYTPYYFTTPAGLAAAPGTADGTGAAARFRQPRAVAADASGNVYVADTQNETIRVIAPGGVVTTLAGLAGTPGGVDGTGTAARFSAPSGIAVDASANLYVADSANYAIRKVTPGGVVSTVAGLIGTGGSADGTGTGARFGTPTGIAVGADGTIYVADTGNNTIRKVTPGGVVTTIAGSAGLAGNQDGTGAGARFNSPSGIAVGADGTIYVSDLVQGTIRRVTMPGGVVTTIAGGGSGFADGTGTAAKFNVPRSLAVDGSGNLYVADANNDEIRLITPAAVVTTLGGFGAGSADGAGSGAQFNQPYGIAVDNSGTVWVADTNNDTIRSGIAWSAPAFVLPASPSSATIAAGRTLYLAVQATGLPAPAYQWKLNGSTSIPGAASTTGATLVVSGATAADSGNYTCTVTNGAGSASSSASIQVVSTSTPGILTNLSARAQVGTGAGILIAGFGTSGSGTKQLLLRAVGPGMNTTFQFPGYLADAELQLYDNTSTLIATDHGWGNAPVRGGSAVNATVIDATAGVMSGLGAFALTAGSLDSAVVAAVPDMAFTYEVIGQGAAPTGVALAEIYDADSGVPPSRLINISARAAVGTSTNVLVGGFTIGPPGGTSETVLIRGVGPGLTATFGLAGTLAAPLLTLFDSSQRVIATDAGWANPPAAGSSAVTAGLAPADANVMATVGAFSLSAGSTDCAILATLPPGGYTAQLSGVNSTTGIGLVEIYDVP
jgi:sugar lactone lactonase YvrE